VVLASPVIWGVGLLSEKDYSVNLLSVISKDLTRSDQLKWFLLYEKNNKILKYTYSDDDLR
jgi:hypothetical protein